MEITSMLQQLRKHSKGWVAGILFFFLILAFAAWGIEDMLRQGFQRSGPVIEVGSQAVGAREFESAYRRTVSSWEQRLQRQIDYETAKKAGLVEQVIAQLETDLMFAQEAQGKGLAISDAVVRADIESDESFRGTDGRFDPNIFRRVVESSGYSQAQYLSLRKAAYARDFLVSSLAQFGHPPKSLADRLFAYRNQTRTAEVLTVPFSAMTVPEPSAEALEAFYKSQSAKYTAPELRSVTLLVVRPENAAQRIEVSEEELRASYEQRKPEFTTPETRTVRQLLLSDEATAKRVYEALVGGRTLEAVAKEIAKTEPQALGNVTAAQLPGDAALRDAVFKLQAGEVTAPIRSPFGWHILRVDEIQPAATKPFEEVREQIAKDLRQRRAVPLLAQLRDQLDDALGGGAKLEDAATKLGFKVRKIEALDATGKDAQSQPVADLPEDQEFLRRAFAQRQGEEGELIDLRNQGFYTLRVDEIRPSAVRPLETIKPQVVQDWKTAEAEKLAKAEAERIAAAARQGQSLTELAKPGDYPVRQSTPMIRGDGSESAEGTLEDRAFSVPPGGVAVASTREGYAVARVSEAKDARTAEELKKAHEEFEKKLEESYQQDMAAAYTAYLRSQYPAEVDRAAIDALFAATRR
jgi:peptidyl-prolyl cis-trans isomerase D